MPSDRRVDGSPPARTLARRRADTPADRCEGIGAAGNQVRIAIPAFRDCRDVAAGIGVDGTGNLITGNNTSRNVLDGIGVSGGTAVSPNVVNSNVSGTAGSGNGRAGIALTGTGSGAGGSAYIKGNTTRGNASDGIQVTGSGHS